MIDSRPIFILGAERSGTSLTAQIVHAWGAYGGDPEELRRSNTGNQQGYFENREMARASFHVLNILYKQNIYPWHENWSTCLEELALEPQFEKAISDLADSMDKSARIWFWKEPNLSILIPFWKRFFRDPTLVMIFREPLDVAISHVKFSHIGATSTSLLESKIERDLVACYLSLWEVYQVSILRDTRQFKNKLFISYESLLDSTQVECERLMTFLNERYDKKENKLDLMASKVVPRMNRNRRSTSPISINERQESILNYSRRMANTRIEDTDVFEISLSPKEKTDLISLFRLRRELRI